MVITEIENTDENNYFQAQPNWIETHFALMPGTEFTLVTRVLAALAAMNTLLYNNCLNTSPPNSSQHTQKQTHSFLIAWTSESKHRTGTAHHVGIKTLGDMNCDYYQISIGPYASPSPASHFGLLQEWLHRIVQCSAPKSKRKQISSSFRQKVKVLGDDSVQILHFKVPHILMNGVFREICHLYCSKNGLGTAGPHHTHHHYILP